MGIPEPIESWETAAADRQSRYCMSIRRVPWIHPGWAMIFLVNLPVCLYFGWMVTREGGRTGMFLGIILLYVLGEVAHHFSKAIGLALGYGGVLVGMTQVFPYFQLNSGWVGLEAAEKLGVGPDQSMGGLIATLVTGGILMAAALVVGLPITIGTVIAREGSDPAESHRPKGPKPIPPDLRDF